MGSTSVVVVGISRGSKTNVSGSDGDPSTAQLLRDAKQLLRSG
jgi:hypothetical protein